MSELPFCHRLAVRFRDCDMMGHANHAVYFTYMEQCRFALWRDAEGKTVNVTFDYATSRTIPIPETTRALLERVRG